MRRFLRGFFYGTVAYLIAAVVGALAIGQFSSNQHDRSLEAAMTGAFVIGPLAALIAFVVGIVRNPAEAHRTESPRGQ